MAKRKRKNYGSHGHRKAKARTNPGAYRTKGRRNFGRRRARRNPGDLSGLLMEGIFATAGAVGAKLLTQAVLGANNTGIIGYAGNAASGLALYFAAGATPTTKKYQKDILIGTVVAIVIRVISDYTSYGSQLALSGMGDYQVQNFLVPQRVVDGLYSSQLQIPAGYGQVVVQSASPPASHAATGGLSGSYDTCGSYDM